MEDATRSREEYRQVRRLPPAPGIRQTPPVADSRRGELSFLIRSINGVGRQFARVGLKPGRFELEVLEAAARKQAKLEDFGAPDYRKWLGHIYLLLLPAPPDADYLVFLVDDLGKWRLGTSVGWSRLGTWRTRQ